MSYRAIIRNFRNCTQQQAETLKQALSLTMSAQTIQYCASHYKNKEKRDPFVEELRMLDLLSESLERDCHSIAPTQFFTNDEFVAGTYADLLNKRGALNAAPSHPCTVAEAANLATQYLLRSQTVSAKHAVTLIPESTRDNQLSGSCGVVAPHHSTYRLRPFVPPLATPAVHDALILLQPQEKQTVFQFNKAIDRLLQNSALILNLNGIYTVGGDGILRKLLEITDSVRINLTALSELGVPLPMTALCNTNRGCRILRVGANQLSLVMNLLKTDDVRATAFAQVTEDYRFTFIREQIPAFSIDSHFLKNLYHYKPCSAKLSNEKALAPSNVHFGCAHTQACTYLSAATRHSSTDTVYQNGTISVAASAAPTQAFFKTSLFTAILPIITLALNGLTASEQNLSIAMELPVDCTAPETVGACMASVLGLYRAQIELAFPARPVILRSFEAIKSPTVAVFGSARGNQTPEQFTASGSFVYCVTPRLTEDGLPDFAALRQMLEQLAAWRRDGAITAYRVLVDQSITDGLLKMKGDYACRLSDDSLASDGAHTLMILIESPKELPLRKIGTVQSVQHKQADPTDVTIPTRTALIWSERPSVVMLAKKNDSDATALCSALEKRGADVVLYADEAENAAPLSRSILTAQYLILCRDTALPDTPQIAFALQTLQRAGGTIFSFSKHAAELTNAIFLKKGFDEQALKAICD